MADVNPDVRSPYGQREWQAFLASAIASTLQCDLFWALQVQALTAGAVLGAGAFRVAASAQCASRRSAAEMGVAWCHCQKMPEPWPLAGLKSGHYRAPSTRANPNRSALHSVCIGTPPDRHRMEGYSELIRVKATRHLPVPNLISMRARGLPVLAPGNDTRLTMSGGVVA